MNVPNVSKVEENTENRVSINNLVKKARSLIFLKKIAAPKKLGFCLQFRIKKPQKFWAVPNQFLANYF